MAKVVNIYLDSDPEKKCEIKDISKVRDLDELMEIFKKNSKMHDLDENSYGFQTQLQNILISDMGDIDKDKKSMNVADHMQDQDYYDNNLQTGTLICRCLAKEAEHACEEIKTVQKSIKQNNESKGGKIKNDDVEQLKLYSGKIRRVSYNLRAKNEVFVTSFVDLQGIQEIMKLIEECEHAGNREIVRIATQILAAVLSYRSGIDAITKRAKKYLEKFFHLADKDEYTKKQCIRIFFNIAKSTMPENFDLINKAAVAHASESKSIAFQTLFQGFGLDDPNITMTLLKFINEMIFQADQDEKKEAKFIAKLESLKISDQLRKWNKEGNEDIQGQIHAYQLSANQITPSQIYHLELNKTRVKDLETHCFELEKKVETYKEQQAMFKIMMNDLELYKQKAEMSKELATYFSPFTPIQTFSQDVLIKQQTTRDNIIDVKFEMKGKDANLIGKYEKELQNLKDVKSKNEILQQQVSDFKDKFKSEQKKNKELEDKSEGMALQVDELKGINTSLQERLKTLIQEKLSGGGNKEAVVLDGGSQALSNFNKEKAELKQEIESLEEARAEQQSTIKDLKKERADGLTRIQELKTQLEEASGSVQIQSGPKATLVIASDDEVQKQLLKYKSDIENFTREVEKLKRENEEFKRAPKPPSLAGPPKPPGMMAPPPPPAGPPKPPGAMAPPPPPGPPRPPGAPPAPPKPLGMAPPAPPGPPKPPGMAPPAPPKPPGMAPPAPPGPPRPPGAPPAPPKPPGAMAPPPPPGPPRPPGAPPAPPKPPGMAPPAPPGPPKPPGMAPPAPPGPPRPPGAPPAPPKPPGMAPPAPPGLPKPPGMAPPAPPGPPRPPGAPPAPPGPPRPPGMAPPAPPGPPRPPGVPPAPPGPPRPPGMAPPAPGGPPRPPGPPGPPRPPGPPGAPRPPGGMPGPPRPPGPPGPPGAPRPPGAGPPPPGMPAAAPVKLITLRKEALKDPKPKKFRAFVWKRIILDKDSDFQVANKMLKAIDKAWAGKKIIWEKIDEEKLMTYDQILESFPDKVAVKKAVVAVVDDPNKPKQILDSKSSDSLSVILMRLPKSKQFLLAVDNLNETQVSEQNLSQIIKSWPNDDFETLMEAYNAEKEAKFAKVETFFIEMGQKVQILNRLKIWQFKLGYEGRFSILEKQYKDIVLGFNVTMENKNWWQVLGAVLYFGNVMNAGNKQRQQADGFEIDAFTKTFSIKSADGKSIMQVILELLQKKNGDIMKLKEQFQPIYDNAKIVLTDLIKDSKKLQGETMQNKGMFENLIKIDPDSEDIKFGKNLKSFFKLAVTDIEGLVIKIEAVSALQNKACDFYLLSKEDEKREKSDKYFAFFRELIDQTHLSLPKIEAPKKAKSAKPDPRAAQKAMMAEMAKKQAEMAAKKK